MSSTVPGVYVEETPTGSRPIEGVPTSVTAFVGRAAQGPVDEAVTVRSAADFEGTFGGPWAGSGLGYAVRAFFANGGTEAVVVRVDEGASAGGGATTPGSTAYLSDPGEARGIRALDAVPTVNLLVLPPVTRDGLLPDEVWPAALAYARERRAFLLVDPPPGLGVRQVIGWARDTGLSGPDGRDAAVYYPRLSQADPLDGGVRAVAASGAVAGVYARTDAARGVWKAPAGPGADVRGVVGPAVALTAAQNDELNPAGINAIRSFAGRGTLVWGSRTLAGADPLANEYRFVPVRRLTLFIEESLERGLQWAVFEPNDAPLWARLRGAVETFLLDLFRRGALAGLKPEEAYVVRCDHTTTTQADIESGHVTVLVGFAPITPAEFLILRIRLRAALLT
jgi:phage tail sheath protein FI